MSYDVYTQVKASEYRKLIEQRDSLLKENTALKAELSKTTVKDKVAEEKTVETAKIVVENETKKENKKGGK